MGRIRNVQGHAAKRIAAATKRVQTLVAQGVRLNPSKASDTYHQAVLKSGTRAEKQASATHIAGGGTKYR